MSCPSLESWLEALDHGAPEPEGAHADCASCAATERDARRLLGAIGAAVPPVADEERFVRRVVARTRILRPRVLALAVPFVAAAAAVLLHAAPRREGAEWIAARGTPAAETAGCDVALVTRDGERLLRDGDHVPAGGRLAFRVRHPEGPRWLGVFAIADSGRVAWYHPAFEDPSDEGETLALPPGPGPTILPESVVMPIGSGAVRVICWQADRPSRVRDADAVIERAAAAAPRPESLTTIDALGGSQTGVLLWFDAASR